MQVRNSSRIVSTPEQIVREHRRRFEHSSAIRIEGIRPDSARVALLNEMEILKPKRSDVLERIIKTFFWVVLGWAIGYCHHFLTM